MSEQFESHHQWHEWRKKVLSGVRVARSLVSCVEFGHQYLYFCPFSFAHFQSKVKQSKAKKKRKKKEILLNL
jgi:hypothetical protein